MIVLFLGSSPAPVADADDPEVKLGATTGPPDVLRCVVQFRRSNDQEGRLILEGLSRQSQVLNFESFCSQESTNSV